jgi:molybdenum cofactor cytidylyltransferase
VVRVRSGRQAILRQVPKEEVISGIVLAAGTSSRLGRPKQLLELGGRPLLQYVIDALSRAGMDEIVIVLGHEADRVAAALELPATARTAFNPDYAEGQSTSLRAGLAAAAPGSDACVVVLGDQPSLAPDSIRQVVQAFVDGDSSIVRAMWEGTPGHPVVFARSVWPELSGLTGDSGARDLLIRRSDVREVEMGSSPVVDVDTWSQYEELKDRF